MILSPCDGVPAASGRLRHCLEKIYTKYNHRELIPPDPLQFVYRYTDPADKEIAAFLAAGLAYGRVQQIEKSIERLLGRMGPRPAAFVRDFDARKRRQLADFRHRFTSGDDISDLLALLRGILRAFGSIEGYFARGLGPKDVNVIPALSFLCDSLLFEYSQGHNGAVSSGLRYLLSSPTRKSACKRLNLFLRWMVRKDEVDVGLWKCVSPAQLLVPLDVHMSRISCNLKLCRKQNPSIRMAVEVTKGFGRICPQDPVRYDFALCRAGMLSDTSSIS